MEEIIEQCKAHMDKVLENYKHSISTLRAGTVSPTVLDKIMCNVYNEFFSIKELATIQTTGATSLLVRPFDPSTVKQIAGAISKSELGIQPNINGNEIRLNFPPLTGERRQQLIKTAKEYTEQAKVALRNIRRDMNDLVKKDKTLAKDVAKDLENDIQKQTDNFTKLIEENFSKKVKEIETI